MNEASFASLNPTLLARKGGAKPAMRPQLAPLNTNGSNVAANLEDLGWNDMGDEANEPEKQSNVLPLTPEPVNQETEAEARKVDQASDDALNISDRPAIHRQQEKLAERIVEQAPLPKKKIAPRRRSALERGKRAAFTLRLDADRHLKLRLASTVRGRSAQQIVTEALDQLLDDMPELTSLAAQVQQR